MSMLTELVRYLHASGVAFSLRSDPSPEELPDVARPLRPGARVVETHVVTVGGAPALVACPAGAGVNHEGMSVALGTTVLPGGTGDLPGPYRRAAHLPPMGGLVGVPLFLDESLAGAPCFAFSAFSPSDLVEVNVDDLMRLEQPRQGPFALGGALPAPEAHP